MRAIVYDRFGPADAVLRLEDRPAPTPGPGEARVQLHASGVNPSDIRARAGGRPGVVAPPYPEIIPHSDGAGVIDAVGAGVDAGRIGERVWIWNGQWRRAFGTAAEFIALPAEQAVRLPDAVSFAEGAALGVPALTACHAVLGGGAVDGRVLFVSGGAGTVGRFAVQIAAAAGARVFATAGDADSRAACAAAGAEAVFDYRDPDLAARVLEQAGGAPIDRIIEVEFGRNAQTHAEIIAEGGRIVAYGSAQEMTPTLPFYPLMFKAVTIELMLVYLLQPAERAAAIGQLTTLLERGALDIPIARRFDLSDCAAAHEHVAAGGRAGAVILEPSAS